MEQKTGEVKKERKAGRVAEQEGGRTARRPNPERGDGGTGSAESEQPQRRAGGLIVRIHESPRFRILIMATVILDAVVRGSRYLQQLFVFEDALVAGMYSLELLIKVWAEGCQCLQRKSTVFDALVLCAVYLYMFGPAAVAPLTSELRAVRILKTLSIPALRDTDECPALYALCLLLVFVFLFRVCGFYCFSSPYFTAEVYIILYIMFGYCFCCDSCTVVMKMIDISKKREATRRKMEEEARAARRQADIGQIRGDLERLVEEFETRPQSKRKG